MILERKGRQRWKPVGIGLVVLLVVHLTSPCLWADNEKDIFKAARLLRTGHGEEALSLYQRLADRASSPEGAAWALLLKATALNLYMHQPQEALGLLATIQNRYPDTSAAAEALFHAGMVAYQQQAYLAACRYFSKYLAQHPAGLGRESAIRWIAAAKEKAASIAATSALSPNAFWVQSPIRVLLIEGADRVKITADDGLAVYAGPSDERVLRTRDPVFFTHFKGGLVLNGRRLKGLRSRIAAERGVLCIDGMPLRGFLTIDLEPEGLQVINQLPIESYLYGIIGKEMPRTWPPNALEAQAIASRTYALYLKGKNRFLPFDLDATTASQVYGGYDAETPQTDAAVDATRGQVMIYANQLIMAYFHANSGGHTENAANIWGVCPPYLRGVTDPFSRRIPNDRWDYPLSYTLASQRLNKAGLNVGTIHAIGVVSRSASGRALTLRLDTDLGKTVISAYNFRMIVDSKGIKSTLFHIVPGPSGVQFIGRGHGHGVGMSQWGACRMAQAGFSYRDILKAYYPGIALTTLSPRPSGH
jgi:stage II sporulation protein D (peptidoglycan lytic transglycosylase)